MRCMYRFSFIPQGVAALLFAVLAGCSTVSLDSPDWPPAAGRAVAPVVTRTPVPVNAPPPARSTLQDRLEDAGVIVTPVAPRALDATPPSSPETGEPQPVPQQPVAQAAAPVSATAWEGHYQGLLPCADCEGIRTILTLNRDSSYVLSLTYVGRNALPLMMRGNFTWNGEETQITLDNHGDYRRYAIQDGEARMLNRDGTSITGVLANSYVLKKQH